MKLYVYHAIKNHNVVIRDVSTVMKERMITVRNYGHAMIIFAKQIVVVRPYLMDHHYATIINAQNNHVSKLPLPSTENVVSARKNLPLVIASLSKKIIPTNNHKIILPTLSNHIHLPPPKYKYQFIGD